MSKKGMRLLIPVENQVRELDPKLLLACIAAERGFSSVIGSRREMEFNIDLFPQSIYLSKSMTIRSLLFFQVAQRFDIEIVPLYIFHRRLTFHGVSIPGPSNMSLIFLPGEKTMPGSGSNILICRMEYPFMSPETLAVTCCGLNCSHFIKRKLKNIRLDTVILSW
jgi:hypothetical protein